MLTPLLALVPCLSAALPTAGIDSDVELALEASGIPPQDRAEARRRIFEWVDGVAASVSEGAPDELKARQVLLRLHPPFGPLGVYEESATTLRDVLEHRHFNCVSATVLYVLAAKAVGLEVEAELLPTHARARVLVGRAWSVVETTSPRGFDPDAAAQDEIAQRVAPAVRTGRSLVEETGERGDLRGLAGAMYVNRASLALEQGALTEAERLFGEGESLAPTRRMKAILRDQRAAVLARLALESLTGDDPERLNRALRTLLQARALEPADERISYIVRRNVRAVTERLIRRHVELAQFEAATRVRAQASAGAPRFERVAFQAFEQAERARRHAKQGELLAALSCLEKARRLELGPEDGDLEAEIAKNLVALLPNASEEAAQGLDLDRAFQLLDQWQREGASAVEVDRQAARSARIAGHEYLRRHEKEAAVKAFRRGLSRSPGDEACRHDLVAALQAQVLPTVRSLDCEGAETSLQEIETLAPGDGFAKKARVECWLGTAEQATASEDYLVAIEALERAGKLAPRDPRWRGPLGQLLSFLTVRWANEGRCEEARGLWPRLRQLAQPVPGRARKRCSN